MARSIDPAPQRAPERGFVPAQNDEERFFMRHIEDLARAATARGIVRYSAFLSDREQALAAAALNRAGVNGEDYRFDGGWPGAERKLLCVGPRDGRGQSPLACVRLCCRAAPGAPLPAHKDYLGSLMNLGVERSCLGDILVEERQTYLFCLSRMASYLCENLTRIRHTSVRAEQVEDADFHYQPRYQEITGTVSSVRLDKLLSLAYQASRSSLVDLIEGGKVFVNGRLITSNGYEPKDGDLISVRGFGRFQYCGAGGQSKKGRAYVTLRRYL